MKSLGDDHSSPLDRHLDTGEGRECGAEGPHGVENGLGEENFQPGVSDRTRAA